MHIRTVLPAILSVFFWLHTALAQDNVVRAAYRVGVADKLHVEVYGERDLSGDFTVDSECKLTLALVGRVAVCGLSTAEVEALITDSYRDSYLVRPVVSVRVIDFKSQKVDVLGEIVTRGPIFLQGPTTLLEVISRAGGPKSDNVVDIEVIDAQGKSTRYKLPLLTASPQMVWVHSGETVYVKPGEVVYVEGEVSRPGVVGLSDGLTVTRALTLVGGPTTYANLRRVVIRHPDGSQERVNVHRIHRGLAKDTPLVADDHVLIGSGPF